ncbi:hypothetical protein GGI20_005991, partial [Coemansia sp. BCRC 34301]
MSSAGASADTEYYLQNRVMVIPRRLMLYSAMFGVSHEGSGEESDCLSRDGDGSDTAMDDSEIVLYHNTNTTESEPEPE